MDYTLNLKNESIFLKSKSFPPKINQSDVFIIKQNCGAFYSFLTPFLYNSSEKKWQKKWEETEEKDKKGKKKLTKSKKKLTKKDGKSTNKCHK